MTGIIGRHINVMVVVKLYISKPDFSQYKHGFNLVRKLNDTELRKLVLRLRSYQQCDKKKIEFKDLRKNIKILTTANNKKLLNVYWRCDTFFISSDHFITLKSGSYVPDLTTNLLYVTKTTQNHLKVKFIKYVIKTSHNSQQYWWP